MTCQGDEGRDDVMTSDCHKQVEIECSVVCLRCNYILNSNNQSNVVGEPLPEGGSELTKLDIGLVILNLL